MKRKMFDVISIILVILSIPMFLSSCKNSDVKNRNDTTHSFNATVIEMELAEKTYVMVEPSQDTAERKSCDRICFEASKLPNIGAKVGSIINVTYKGDMIDSSLYKEALIRGSSLKSSLPERCPVQINAIDWRIVDDTRNTQYTEQWLEKTDKNKCEDNNLFDNIKITKIYSNCFFAQTVMPMPYEIKLNGALPSKWCVGDQVICTYENTYYNAENNRVEADMLTIKESDWQPDPFVAYKPVIYLYPEKETEVSVKLKLNGELTCTYPEYNEGWKVLASPDGTLTDTNGQIYNYLYWEGNTYTNYDFSEGFCVKGKDTAKFLEDSLQKLGLTRKEANEFIVYWLPLMQNNKYNIISFQTTAYTSAAKLNIDPSPDTLIRVFMAWKPSENFIDIPAQHLSSPERKGFTVIEWGGTNVGP